MKSGKLAAVVLAFPVLGFGAPAGAAESAKDYPNRPVRLMVPNAPGSSVDTLSRVVATSLSRQPRRCGGRHCHADREGREP
jgi:tripartite-type tricarboxylate transporter receptor subunit TctC